MKAYIYTDQHFRQMMSSLTLEASCIARFSHEVLKEYTSFTDYFYEILTTNVEEYTSLIVAQDYQGQYDKAFELYKTFGGLTKNSDVMPEIRYLDIRVVSLPLQTVELDRTIALMSTNCGLGHTLEYPFSEQDSPVEFTYITNSLINMLEAHYFNGQQESSTKHLLFAKHNSSLCVFVH